MSTINISHLRLLAIYATVVECGSFAGAAHRLNTSRSRISEQVASLEADLGVRLLQRSTRKLKITPEGDAVYRQAAKLNELLTEVEAVVAPERPSGRVAITMNHDIAHLYFLPVMEKFHARYPEVQLDIILDDSRLDLIEEQIDLAIRIGYPRDDSVIARMLHEERFALYASPEYLEKNGTPSSLESLKNHRWVLFTQVTKGATQQLRYQGQIVEIRPENYYRCNSPLMGQQMLIRGLGLGVLLPGTVRKEVREGRLLQLMPEISSDPLIFSLVYPSRRQIPQRIRVLIDFLVEEKIFS
ncbi:MAG: LysR substrate-binding domain-containing protein [Thiolinea sp.]